MVRNGTFRLIDFDYTQVEETEMKIWEVLTMRIEPLAKASIDPLILDLNRDGKFDITGPIKKEMAKSTQRSFDIDPSKQSWKLNSGHRPGYYEGRMSSHVVLFRWTSRLQHR